MTLYQVDRVIYEVGRTDEALASFLADPDAYLADRKLEERERQALRDCDYAALWTMGAHPFILFGFVRRVLGARGQPPDQITRAYKAAIEPLGRPSYAT
jgi:hypothetical protein